MTSLRSASALAAAIGIFAAAGVASAADTFKGEYDKGAAAFAAGDYPVALGHFEKAYKLKAHPIVLFNIGQAHRKMEHVDEAIAAYTKYLATKPAPDLKAETEGYLADLAKAKEARKESDEGARLSAAGDFAGAAARYLRAYAIRPVPALLYSIGLSYEKAGNKVKAIEYYESFLKTDTDPKLRAEAEAALKALRVEPDPIGKGGAPVVAPGPGDPGPGPGPALPGAVTDPPPEKRGGSKAVVFVVIGGGAALVVGAVVVGLAVALSGPKVDESLLGSRVAEF